MFMIYFRYFNLHHDHHHKRLKINYTEEIGQEEEQEQHQQGDHSHNE